MIKPHRQQPLWFAFIVHRVSGLALAIFLPVHFYVLSLALNADQKLDQLLVWAEQPLVKAAEFILVSLLAVHLFGGLRLMALELMPWQDKQKTLAAAAVAVAFLVGLLFLLRALS